jgi:hypothetical protein
MEPLSTYNACGTPQEHVGRHGALVESLEKMLGAGFGQRESLEGGVSLVFDGGQPAVIGRPLHGFEDFIHDELPVASGGCRVGG